MTVSYKASKPGGVVATSDENLMPSPNSSSCAAHRSTIVPSPLNRRNCVARVRNATGGFIDYRLIALGVRVSRDSCQLIEHVHGDWDTFGWAVNLPLNLPDEILPGYCDTTSIIALLYCRLSPETDLRDLLALRRSFSEAIEIDL